jgi:hypothetical protein
MAIHDWTRVSAGTFHHFHGAWITHLSEALNNGMLPEGYYALSEQQAGHVIADVLTPHVGDPDRIVPRGPGMVTVAEAPPRVSRKFSPAPDATYRATRRTLTIRHASTHRIVALLEILSPANKDRASSVREFVDKAQSALRHGCHLLVVDLFPPATFDPRGIHGAIWELYDPYVEAPPDDKPLTLAAYVANDFPDAYLEPIGVGDVLPDMPLFLDADWYVNVPLEATYQTAYRGVPAYWRGVIEGTNAPGEN